MEYRNAVMMQRPFWLDTLKTARVIIDATAGNGHDTAFLLTHKLEEAHVYGIDTQEQAIQSCSKNLRDKGFSEREYTLFRESHANVDDLPIPKPYDLCVFNLGYLPKGNHEIMTTSETTVAAIRKMMQGLAAEGLITVVAYPGTDQGMAEMQAVEAFVRQIDQKEYHISQWRPLNQVHNPPVLFLIKGRVNHEKISL